MLIDRRTISDFLRALRIPEPALFQTWGPECGPKAGQKSDGRCQLATASEVVVRQQFGLGVAINEIAGDKRTIDNVVAPRAVFVDIDSGQMPGHALLERATAIVRSPRGGHVYWAVEGSMRWSTWRALQWKACDLLGGDPCGDRARAMRLPGSLHWKTGEPLLLELVHCMPDARLRSGELCELFGVDDQADEDEEPNDAVDPSRMPGLGQRIADYKRWLLTQAPAVEGEHGHDQTLRICMRAGDYALEWHDCDQELLEWNEHCRPPWSAGELRRQFVSAQRSRRMPRGVAYMTRMVVPDEQPRRARPRPTEVAIAEPDPATQPDAKAPPLRIDPDDPLAIAEAFLRRERWADGHRTLQFWRGYWWLWEDGRFRVYDRDALSHDLWFFLADCWVGHGKTTRRLKPNEPLVRSVTHALRAVCYMESEQEPPFWITLPEGLPPRHAEHLERDWAMVRNGMLHLPTRRFIAATPRLFNLARVCVEYSPGQAGCPQWISFLRELWPKGDAPEILQEWFGYCLTSDMSQQKALMLVGPRRGGKGTIAHVLRNLLGYGSVAASGLNDLQNQFGLADMAGKTVAIIPDAKLSDRSDQGIILERLLSIIGGDPVSLEKKTKDAKTVDLKVRFVILANPPLPRISDPSGAFAARMLPLALTRSWFGQEDTELRARLVTELAGIFEWAVGGWERLHAQRRFSTPSTSLVTELEQMGNPVLRFVHSCCDLEPAAFQTTRELHNAYRRWATASGERSMGAPQLSAHLNQGIEGVAEERPRQEDGSRARGYRGIRIRWSDVPDST